MSKYNVVNKDWDLDWGRKSLKDCIIFTSDKLKDCKDYIKEHKLTQDRIVGVNGRIAIGDWYGAYDNDLGWEYD